MTDEPLTIETVDNPSTEVLDNEIADHNRPVLLTNVLEQWPAFSRWSAEYLGSRLGSQPVRVTVSRGRVYNRADYVHMAFDEFLQKIHAEPPDQDQYYMTGIDPRLMPELNQDLGVPALVDDGRELAPHMFMGRDSVTGCHYHTRQQNLAVQLTGRKRVILFAPSDWPNLYANSIRHEYYNWSQVPDILDYDRDRFPRVGRARRYEVTLNPGDVLHIPVHWWHSVYGEGFSATVSFFWPARKRDWNWPQPGLQTAVRSFTGWIRGFKGESYEAGRV